MYGAPHPLKMLMYFCINELLVQQATYHLDWNSSQKEHLKSAFSPPTQKKFGNVWVAIMLSQDLLHLKFVCNRITTIVVSSHNNVPLVTLHCDATMVSKIISFNYMGIYHDLY